MSRTAERGLWAKNCIASEQHRLLRLQHSLWRMSYDDTDGNLSIPEWPRRERAFSCECSLDTTQSNFPFLTDNIRLEVVLSAMCGRTRKEGKLWGFTR